MNRTFISMDLYNILNLYITSSANWYLLSLIQCLLTNLPPNNKPDLLAHSTHSHLSSTAYFQPLYWKTLMTCIRWADIVEQNGRTFVSRQNCKTTLTCLGFKIRLYHTNLTINLTYKIFPYSHWVLGRHQWRPLCRRARSPLPSCHTATILFLGLSGALALLALALETNCH